jgi:hypothetical protein
MKKSVKKYSVRGGTKAGSYIKAASPSFAKRTGRKYAWTNVKSNRVVLPRNTAIGIALSYGGSVIAE